jgi:hypothetical protein
LADRHAESQDSNVRRSAEAFKREEARGLRVRARAVHHGRDMTKAAIAPAGASRRTGAAGLIEIELEIKRPHRQNKATRPNLHGSGGEAGNRVAAPAMAAAAVENS